MSKRPIFHSVENKVGSNYKIQSIHMRQMLWIQ